MLVPNQQFDIKITTSRQREHYQKKGYYNLSIGEIIKVKFDDLPKSNEIKIRYICDYCKEEKTRGVIGYFNSLKSSKLKKDACQKCTQLRRRESQGEIFTDEKLKSIVVNRKNKLGEEFKIKEFDLENKLIENISLIESGMTFINRQVEIEDGRIDILARDINNTLCIIELKVVDDDMKIVFQSAYYPTQFEEKTRLITITPAYHQKIKKALQVLEYVEMKTYKINKDKLKIHDVDKHKYMENETA